MQSFGGFEHNLQSLRVVDVLEQRYGAFDGLNLCFETREGILKHCSRENARGLGEVGLRFLQDRRPTLEAQLANLADEIAYNNHDVDDGLRSGLVSIDQLSQVEMFNRHLHSARSEYPALQDRRLIHETVRRMINTLVTDLAMNTARHIANANPATVDEVRAAPVLAAFSSQIEAEQRQLKRFLRVHLYQHFRVARMSNKSRRIVRELFEAFMAETRLLPPEFQRRAEQDTPRAIADYIAGMTDRYAIREHRRLFSVEEA